jgi:glucokinase
VKSSPAIVADIGGTNARFATWIDGKLEKRWQRPCDGLTGLAEAVQLYLDQADMTSRPQRIALAVAGPADADKVIMTSRTWSISAADLKALGFSDVLLANDIGDEGAPATGAPLVVVGPGTGLGVAVYTRQDDGGLALQTQGGHVGFAPQDDVEATLLSILRRSLGRVSTEHILSGAGLVRLHHALAQMDGRQVSETSAAAIGEGAAIDAACRATPPSAATWPWPMAREVASSSAAG